MTDTLMRMKRNYLKIAYSIKGFYSEYINNSQTFPLRK